METTPRQVVLHTSDGAQSRDDLLVTEAPLEIRIEGTPIAVIMRTPGRDAELVLGFSITEGIVSSPDEAGSIAENQPG